MRGFLLLVFSVTACSSSGGPSAPGDPHAGQGTPVTGNNPSSTYDVDARGIPRFVSTSHMDLALINRISRFRSSVGHDYHDDFESCRSMKHYFEPKSSVDWSTVRVVSPVTGKVSLTRSETLGLQVVIRPDAYPAFTIVLFHIKPTLSIDAGTVLQAGQQLGTHWGPQTMSDVGVSVDTPTGYKLVSWFDVITDSLFSAYTARGVTSRDALMITRPARDADPLTCNGETFLTTGALAAWTQLN